MFLARSSLFFIIFKMTIGQSTVKTISKDYFPDVEYPASVTEVEPFYYKPSERDLFDSLGTEIKSTTFANVAEVRDNKRKSGVNNNDFTKSSSNHMNVDNRNNKISLTSDREEIINGTLNIKYAINEQEVNNAINKIVDMKSIEGVANNSEANINNSNIRNSKPSLRVLKKYSNDNNSNIIYEYTTPSMILNVTSNSTYDTSNDLVAEDVTIEAVAAVQVYLNPVLKNSNNENDSLNTISGPDESTLGTPNHIDNKTYVLKDNNTLLETEDYVKNNDKPNFIKGNTNKLIEEVAQNIETDVGEVASNIDMDKLQNPISTKAVYSQINDISSNKSTEEIIQNNNSVMAQLSNVDTDGLENSIGTITASSQINEISLNKSMGEIVQNNDSDVAQMSSNLHTDELKPPIDTKIAYSQISEISSNNNNGINVKDTNKIIKSQNDGKIATQNVAVSNVTQKNNTIGHLFYIDDTQDLNNAENLVYLGKYTQPLQFVIKRA